MRDTIPGFPEEDPPWGIEGEPGGSKNFKSKRPFEADIEGDATGLTTHAAILENIRETGLNIGGNPHKLTRKGLIMAYREALTWWQPPPSCWANVCKKCGDSVLTCSCYPLTADFTFGDEG